MPKVWVVRADGGKLTDEFIDGDFASIGWEMGDLRSATTLDAVRQAYDREHPRKLATAAANVSNQIHAFMNEMNAGDLVLTPTRNSGVVRFGELCQDAAVYAEPTDAHQHVNRRKVCWSPRFIRRALLPDSTRAALRNLRTVFLVSDDKEEFISLPAVQEASETPFGGTPAQEKLLQRIIGKNPGFFELLIAELLKAMGCRQTDVRGGPGDGGIDVATQVSVPFSEDMRMIVQAKRLKRTSNVNMAVIKKLEESLEPEDRGLVITTADFTAPVWEHVAKQGPRVGLVNGPNLADELRSRWLHLPKYFRDELGPLPTDPT